MHQELFCNLNITDYPLIHQDLPIKTRVMNTTVDEVSKSIHDLLFGIGIKVDSPGWLYCSPEYITHNCHIDGDFYNHNSNWTSLCKLNYVIGGPNVTTCWYDVPDNVHTSAKKNFTSTGFPYWVFKISDCNLIESQIMSGWHLFDAGVPHNIVNHKSEQRWNLTIILKDIETGEWLTFVEVKHRMSLIGLC